MLAVDTHVLVRLLARDARQALAADQAVAGANSISHLVLAAEAIRVLDAVTPVPRNN